MYSIGRQYINRKGDNWREAYEAFRTLLAGRSYPDKGVPETVVRKIVEVGHLTASSMNLQTWHFVVVQDRKTLQELGSTVRTGPYIAQAVLVSAIAVEKNSKFGVSDASRAAQDMMLAAWDDGVGSNKVVFGGMDRFSGWLGTPAELELLAAIPFGYTSQSVRRGKKKRKPLADRARRKR